MRRNLTLEDAGVLDLRKFIDTPQKWAEWTGNYILFIPVDWLVAQGYEHSQASWNDEQPNDWFKSKFHNFIISYPDNSELILYAYADTRGSFIATGIDVFNINSNGISDGENWVLEFEEL